MRQSPAPGRLVSVRLTDVPLDVRLAAVRGVRPERFDESELERPEDRLFARLAGGGQAELAAAAIAPSNRVYWVPREAAEAVLGKTRT